MEFSFAPSGELSCPVTRFHPGAPTRVDVEKAVGLVYTPEEAQEKSASGTAAIIVPLACGGGAGHKASLPPIRHRQALGKAVVRCKAARERKWESRNPAGVALTPGQQRSYGGT
jgi:hypothetical protein